MKKLLLIFLCLPLLVFSQNEKRLALVIGNANYDKGPLNNPVNDALLMAQTLDSLDFDVILDTNIANKEKFIKIIREFGNKRSDYDVAFVYYAGHGIQVGAENFLLPTKVKFETEYDVVDFGVSVQNIMRYLTGMTDQVNILVLDACRDNPFEGNWNRTRSLKGSGLAKIPPHTGSLIAFSTDAGNTAADGDGENSIYCESLCKNMMLESTSLDQVFRNVRSDVLKLTDNHQRPVESSQLTGSVYYLNTVSIESINLKINNLILENKLDSALYLVNLLIYKFPKSGIGYLNRAYLKHISALNDGLDNNAEEDYLMALKLDDKLFAAYYYGIDHFQLGIIPLLQLLERDDESRDFNNRLIELMKNHPLPYIIKFENMCYNLTLNYSNIIELDNIMSSFKIEDCYLEGDKIEFMNNISEQEYSYSIYSNYYNIKQMYFTNIEVIDSTIKYLDLIIEQSVINSDSSNISYCYSEKSQLYADINDTIKALEYINKSISFERRATNLMDRGWLYHTYYPDSKKAEENLSQSILMAKTDNDFLSLIYALLYRSTYYKSQKLYTLSLLDIDDAIRRIEKLNMESNNMSKSGNYAYFYVLRGRAYQFLKIDRYCSDFQIACDLGNCEIFNTDCK